MLKNSEQACGCATDWHIADEISNCSIGIQKWLTDRGSLTARLKEYCLQFHVDVVFEGRADIDPNEQTLLGLRSDRYWVREVYLYGDASPWVFARSVLAIDPDKPQVIEIQGLAQRPLGELLFSGPALNTGARLAGHFIMSSPFVHAYDGDIEQLWGRRTKYEYEGLPLVVTEVFLPSAPIYWGE